VSAVDDALHVAPLHTEVIELVSSSVAEGGGPGVVVFLFKACGCDDQVVLGVQKSRKRSPRLVFSSVAVIA
jgi:hypothetical protein